MGKKASGRRKDWIDLERWTEAEAAFNEQAKMKHGIECERCGDLFIEWRDGGDFDRLLDLCQPCYVIMYGGLE